jgi:hypothetical protein
VSGGQIVQSLGYLAEMCGDSTTIAEAELVRDALIEQGLLTWEGDMTGGRICAISDEAFYALVAEALAEALAEVTA